jgi:CBS domain-containing protein
MLEDRIVDFQLNLDSEPIGHAFSTEIVSVPPSQSIRDVIDQLSAAKQGCALVCEEGRLVGVFTERDALSSMASDADLSQPVSAAMADPVTVTSTEPMATAITKMATGGFRQLPVVDTEHKPLGMLKVSCILNYFVQHFPSTIYTLPPAPDRVAPTREGA